MDFVEIVSLILMIVAYLLIGLGPVVAIIVMIYAHFDNKRTETLNEYRKIHWNVQDEYDAFCSINPNLDETKALRKFFSDKKIYEKALNLQQYKDFEYENYQNYIFTRLSKEDIIRKREYSYKYEKVIYEIFSPWGKYISDEKWLLYKDLSDEEIIGMIGERLRLNLKDSIALFEEFIDNGLIQKTKIEKQYVLGYILYHWDCLSENDWSFSKWMTFKKNKLYQVSEFDDFVNEYGAYDVVNENNNWYIRFGNSRHYPIKIFISEQKLIDLVYSYGDNPKCHKFDFEFGRDNAEVTKSFIYKMIEDNHRYLYIQQGYSLNYNYRKYKKDNQI